MAWVSSVRIFSVRGETETQILSLKTTYAAYLVFKFDSSKHGFDGSCVALSINFKGMHVIHKAYLDPPDNKPQLCQEREDGWMEIEIGEFFNENGQDGSVVCRLWDNDVHTTRHGLLVEGIEFRPKEGKRW